MLTKIVVTCMPIFRKIHSVCLCILTNPKTQKEHTQEPTKVSDICSLARSTPTPTPSHYPAAAPCE